MTGQGPLVQIHEKMRGRLDTRFKLELGDRLYALLVEMGVYPVLMRDIRKNTILLELWREMSHNIMPLICHIVGATRLRATRRDFNGTMQPMAMFPLNCK
jgi:hypothetical protein